MILYICSKQRCKDGGRAWLASLGFREGMAIASNGVYKQLCPHCGAEMIKFEQDEPIMISKLLIPDELAEEKPETSWPRIRRKRETKRIIPRGTGSDIKDK